MFTVGQRVRVVHISGRLGRDLTLLGKEGTVDHFEQEFIEVIIDDRTYLFCDDEIEPIE